MNLRVAFLGLIGVAAPTIKADDFIDIDTETLAETRLIEWSDDFEQEDKGPQGILGGEYIEHGSRPWLVPVVGKYFCGGSLISPRAVMTAAHCVISPGTGEWHPPSWIDIHRYSWFDSTGVKRLYINDRSQCGGDVVYHPYYNETELDYDVAIVILPEPVTDVTPVQLNQDKKIPKAETKLDVAGWGKWDQKLPYLNYWGPAAVNVTYVGDNDVCTARPYRWPDSWILESMMCAIGEAEEGPEGSCSGDSGGPLNSLEPGGGPSNVQVGIVSWGIRGCYHQAFPQVYTRVSEVQDWVKEAVCAKTGELCKQSKAGKVSKNSKIKKKYPELCEPVPTEAPSTPGPTWPPSITPQPSTPWPTWNATTTFPPSTAEPTTFLEGIQFPTWMPTQAKSGKE